MSELDNLLSQVEDEGLRTQLKAQVDRLTRQMRFGLVFERHIPESIRDYNAPITLGDLVAIRAEINGGDEYTVERLTSRTAEIVSVTTRESRTVKPRELVVVKRFGEPAYPSLVPLGSVRRSDERPAHAVINGENYHTLQLLRYLYRGQVDCIYIDPPYNTGNSDWQYNNRYIDTNDRWRHSKWLSFMERRLEIAKDLLKPDGVVIVTIDEHEVHHLGVLLEQVFTGYLQYTVTIVHNPKGTGKVNFSRVNEYAIYCVPDTGDDVILGVPPEEADALTGGRTTEHEDQLEADEAPPDAEDVGDYDDDEELVPDADIGATAAVDDLPFPPEELPLWELRHARRRGNESGYRHQRPNQFYPLYVNPETEKVIRAGDSIPLDQEPDFTPQDGLVPLWPIDREGNERCWRYIPSSMQERIDARLVVLGQRDGDTWTVNYWTRRVERKRYKTVWWSKQHDAGTHGTSLLPKFLGRRNAFPIPEVDLRRPRLVRDPSRYLLVIDEAHRGMDRPTTAASQQAASIVQRFIFGTEGMRRSPVVLGISATPQRFDELVAGAQRTIRRAEADIEQVRASGLLKERIIVWRPEHGMQHSEFTLLQRAAQTLQDYDLRWSRYTGNLGLAPVVPVMVVQVEDRTGDAVTATNLQQAIDAIEEVTGPLHPDSYAHCFGDAPAPIVVGSRRIRYIRPVDIDTDPQVTVVFFKTSLSTGWDCPRAEVIMSFRPARDATYIAQLVGRLVRTPLAQRVESDEVLNSVALYLPRYDRGAVQNIVRQLRAGDPDFLPGIEAEEGNGLVTCERRQDLYDRIEHAIRAIRTYVVPRARRVDNPVDREHLDASACPRPADVVDRSRVAHLAVSCRLSGCPYRGPICRVQHRRGRAGGLRSVGLRWPHRYPPRPTVTFPPSRSCVFGSVRVMAGASYHRGGVCVH